MEKLIFDQEIGEKIQTTCSKQSRSGCEEFIARDENCSKGDQEDKGNAGTDAVSLMRDWNSPLLPSEETLSMHEKDDH
jgi:hypothetical protein